MSCGPDEAMGANMLLRNMARRAGDPEGLVETGSRRRDNGLTGGKAGDHDPCDRDQANFPSFSIFSAIWVAMRLRLEGLRVQVISRYTPTRQRVTCAYRFAGLSPYLDYFAANTGGRLYPSGSLQRVDPNHGTLVSKR